MQKRQCFIKLWSLVAVLCLSSGNLYAADAPAPQASASKVQGATVKVSGTVLDELGEGIPGASVKLKGGSKGAITDIDGSFVIDVPKGSKLEITYIGYTPRPSVSATRSLIPFSSNLRARCLTKSSRLRSASSAKSQSSARSRPSTQARSKCPSATFRRQSPVRSPVRSLCSALPSRVRRPTSGSAVSRLSAPTTARLSSSTASNARWTLSTLRTSSLSRSSRTLPLPHSTVCAVQMVSYSSPQNAVLSPSPKSAPKSNTVSPTL